MSSSSDAAFCGSLVIESWPGSSVCAYQKYSSLSRGGEVLKWTLLVILETLADTTS